MIKDSGNRQEFATGAVRDIQEGKGRFDLLPLEIMEQLGNYNGRSVVQMLKLIHKFMETGDESILADVAVNINFYLFDDDWQYIESLAKHFEAGAKKYGDNNWRLGIPCSRYIDSAVRHFYKYLCGQADEDHKTAFAWNILCCLWTCKHKPELNDYRRSE